MSVRCGGPREGDRDHDTTENGEVSGSEVSWACILTSDFGIGLNLVGMSLSELESWFISRRVDSDELF